MFRGKVKWYNQDKGYGIIEIDDGRQVFGHYTQVQSRLKALIEDQLVDFDLYQEDNGRYSAKNIIPVDKEELVCMTLRKRKERTN